MEHYHAVPGKADMEVASYINALAPDLLIELVGWYPGAVQACTTYTYGQASATYPYGRARCARGTETDIYVELVGLFRVHV